MLKKEGTDHFKAERWDQALASYKSAVGRLPKRRVVEPKATQSDPEQEADETQDVNGTDEKGKQKDEDKDVDEPEPVVLTGLQLECAQARAILNANIGACHVKLVSRVLSTRNQFQSYMNVDRGNIRKLS